MRGLPSLVNGVRSDRCVDTTLRCCSLTGIPHLLGVRGFKSHLPHHTIGVNYIPCVVSIIMQVSLRDIHHYDKRLERALSDLREDNSLLEDNKNTILSYVLYREAQGLSIPRQVHYIFTITKLSTLLENKCFQDATKNDLVNVISQIERNYTSFETKRTEKECMKCFYRWLKGGEEGQEYPLEVRWIKSKRAKNHSFLPENLLTEVEVKLMAESCSNARD